jgi:hypothetical protein
VNTVVEVCYPELRLTAVWQPPLLATPTHLLATIRPAGGDPDEGFWHQGIMLVRGDFAAYVMNMGMPLGTVVYL